MHVPLEFKLLANYFTKVTQSKQYGCILYLWRVSLYKIGYQQRHQKSYWELFGSVALKSMKTNLVGPKDEDGVCPDQFSDKRETKQFKACVLRLCNSKESREHGPKIERSCQRPKGLGCRMHLHSQARDGEHRGSGDIKAPWPRRMLPSAG